jgi:hypothetical protein
MSDKTYFGEEDPEEIYMIKKAEYRGKTSIHPPCIGRALSGRHILIIGTTGSGKTYAAAYMLDFLDAFVFINTQRELEVTQKCQVSLDDPSELQEAMEEGYRGIEFIPSMDKDTAREEVQVLREQIFEIGEAMKAKAQVLELPMWITVFLDEAQVYAPIMTHKDGEIFWDQGRGFGIRGVAISRQPQELSKDIVNNCEFELIFRLGDYAIPYFTRFKIPIEQHQEWTDKTHHFLLYDKRKLYRCNPI